MIIQLVKKFPLIKPEGLLLCSQTLQLIYILCSGHPSIVPQLKNTHIWGSVSIIPSHFSMLNYFSLIFCSCCYNPFSLNDIFIGDFTVCSKEEGKVVMDTRRVQLSKLIYIPVSTFRYFSCLFEVLWDRKWSLCLKNETFILMPCFKLQPDTSIGMFTQYSKDMEQIFKNFQKLCFG
jgi:hypothetical protein